MIWLKTSEERSSGSVLENPRHPIAQALSLFGGDRTITGRSMNDGRALSLAAIYNAVAMISGDLATSPLKVYRRGSDGSRIEEDGHPLTELLSFQPSPGVGSSSWREAAQAHLLLRGNCYTEIIRNRRGLVTELRLHAPNNVSRVDVGASWVYKITPDQRYVNAGDMLHIPGPGGNGIDGFSVIKLGAENWGLYSALEESNARFIANGSRPSGFLSTESKMNKEQLEKLKSLWHKRNAGLDNVGTTPVLDGGFSWQQIGLNAEDSQYIESRKLAITDIARWFNIPPHKLKDLERATFSNVEEQSIDYVRGTLRPWAVRWEQHSSIKLLTEAERRSGLYLKVNLDALLRGDIQARSQAYRTQFEMGAITPNEIRALEERNPIPDGDRAMVRLDMVPLSKIDEVQATGTEENELDIEAESRQLPREYRSHDTRMALRSSFRPMFAQQAERMVSGEVRDIKRLLQKRAKEDWTVPEWREKLNTYYFEQHPDFAVSVMGPLLRSYAEAVSVAAADEIETDIRIDAVALADEYTRGFVDRYAAQSRYDLLKRDDVEEVEGRLVVWADGDVGTQSRAAQVTQHETVKVGEYIARQMFVAGGVMSLVWRSVGDSCPYCSKLNGRRVDSRSSFIEPNESLEGDGDVAPLKPAYAIRHAPAHKGCDCIILPGS